MTTYNFSDTTFSITGKTSESRVTITSDLAAAISTLLQPAFENQKCCLIYDTNIPPDLLEEVSRPLQNNGFSTFSLPFTADENTKELSTIRQMAEFLSENHFSRKDLLISVGGGVTGDTVGFTAATYMRGVDYIQIPTTLLAMIDASIGGKTAVNIPGAKNIIGAFHLPSHVIICQRWLNTLPEKEWRSGFGEMLKYGLLHSSSLFSRVVNQMGKSPPSAIDWELIDLIRKCVEIKVDVVNRDERELDFRRILNLGHTFAHALETITNYSEFSHGEAVYFGLVAAVNLSRQVNLLPENIYSSMLNGLLSISLPRHFPDVNLRQFMEIMQRDKKAHGERLFFILLENYGQPFISGEIDHSSITNSLENTFMILRKR